MGIQSNLPDAKWLPIISVLFSFTFFLYRRLMRSNTTNVHRLPGPDNAHWLWGHEKLAASGSIDDQYSEWFNAYGETIVVTGAFGAGKTVVTADPNVISHAFTKKQPNYHKASYLKQIYTRVLGNSVTSSEDSQRKAWRAAIAPAFSSERVRAMEGIVVDSTQRVISTLKKHIRETPESSGGKDEGVLVNALDWTGQAGLDIIARVGWGGDIFGRDSTLASEVYNSWNSWAKNSDSFTSFWVTLLYRAFPWLNLIPIPIKPVRSQSDIGKRVAKALRPTALERLSKLQANGRSVGAEKDADADVLSFLISASISAGDKVDVDELVQHMIQTVMLGSAAPSVTLAYTIHALARSPGVQEKLRAELADYNKDLTYDDLQNPKILPYLDAVVKEGFRRFPILGHTERIPVADDVIPLKYPVTGKDGKTITELQVHAGQSILFPLVAISNHSSIWGPSGGEFKPSRWLEHPESVPQVMPGGYQNLAIFGAGPRQCLGMRLGILEVKVLLAAIVRNFKIEDSGLEVTTKYALILQSFVVGGTKDGEGPILPVKLVPLQQEIL